MSFERASLSILIALVATVPVWTGPRLDTVRRMARVVVISENERLADDLMIVSQDARIEGTVEGDVLVFTDELVVTGVIEGDLLGFARRAEVTGEVQGSVRLTGGNLRVEGRVGEDLTPAVIRLTVSGSVDRDIYALGAELEISGSVGRDVAGRLARRTLLSGEVGRDLEPVTPTLVVTDRAVVGGTVVVWPGTDANIAATADVGSVAERSTAGSQLQVRAAVLLIRIVVSILFVLAGVGLFWLFPRSLQRAVGKVRTRPLPSLLWGLVIVAVPVALVLVTGVVAAAAPVLVAGPSLAVLVPLTLVVLALAAVALLVAPIPVLAAAGTLLRRGRVSPVGGFVVAAIVWLVLIALPYVGGLVTAAVMVIGLGAWATGALEARGDPQWAFDRPDPDEAVEESQPES